MLLAADQEPLMDDKPCVRIREHHEKGLPRKSIFSVT